REEGEGVGDFFGLGEASQGHSFFERAYHALGNGLDDGGLDEARADGVGAYAPPPELLGPGLHHADHAELAGRVVGLAEIAIQADDGGSVEDDPRLLLQHRVHHGPGAVIDALQIDVDHVVELLVGHVLQLGVHDDAGVVHQAIDPTPARHDGIHHGAERRQAAHIGRVPQHLPAHPGDPLDRVLYPLRAQVAHHDLRSFACELERGGLAYAAARPGNDRDLVDETPVTVHLHGVTHSNTNSPDCSAFWRVAQLFN